MRRNYVLLVLVFAPLVGILVDRASAQQQTAKQPVGFFITSSTGGTGDLGGLAGADKRCQTLAAAAGAGARRSSSNSISFRAGLSRMSATFFLYETPTTRIFA